MNPAIRSLVLLITIYRIAFAASQPEYPFAAGTDKTGWAHAESNASGQVMIESPEFPRGLWVNVTSGVGQAIPGIQVQYQGDPNGFVAIRCVDPAGLRRETLLWTRPRGPLRLPLQPSKRGDLPEGLAQIDWRVDPNALSLLKPLETTRLEGWDGVSSFFQERWQGRTGRVAVQMAPEINLVVDLDISNAVDIFLANLKEAFNSGPNSFRTTPLEVQIFEGDLSFGEAVIIHASFFESAELETAVRGAVGIQEGPITLETLASLTVLFATNNTITSLAGLENCTSLRRLELDGNNISDLQPLAGLTALTTLVMRRNAIRDLTPIANLTNLQRLVLNNNQVGDMDPVTDLVNLRWLDLDSNRITDLGPVANLTNLEQLWMSRNQIIDVTPVENLKRLDTLVLGDNRIVDVRPIGGLKTLGRLFLNNNEIADLTPLFSLPDLYILWLQENRIEDISPLVQNSGLNEGDTVRLEANPLSDIALNEQIPALQKRGVTVRY